MTNNNKETNRCFAKSKENQEMAGVEREGRREGSKRNARVLYVSHPPDIWLLYTSHMYVCMNKK